MASKTIPIPFAVTLPDPGATTALAQALAGIVGTGDVIALRGDLGTGKTTFARAFIRARLARVGRLDQSQDIPSPTFTLVQVYDDAEPPVWHFDLYRLDRPEDAYELGIEEAFVDAISLIEWPERLEQYLPRDYLEVIFTYGDGETMRNVRLIGHGNWRARVAGLTAS